MAKTSETSSRLAAAGRHALALGFLAALITGSLTAVAGLARGQDPPPPKKPDASPSPTPDKPTPDKPTPDKPAPDKPAPDKPAPDKPAPDKAAPDKKTPDKADSKTPDDLARILKRFEQEKEPARSVECAYSRTLYYHLARDLDRVVGCFHPDFELHDADGALKKVTPEELRGLLKKNYESTPATNLTLEQMLDFAHIRVYSKEEAHASKDEGWHKEPREISLVMGDGDLLVIAPVRTVAQGDKPTAFDSEVFYVFRRDGNDWKIVLGE